jgi:hypothetical protein
MADCDIELYFGDSATTTTSGSGTTADPILVHTVGSAVVEVTGGEAASPTSGPSITLTQTNGNTITIPLCSVAGPGGLTGQPVGAMTVGCSTLDLAGAATPEAGWPAVGFPEFWQQTFTGGQTGSEIWRVLADTTGQLQWHQVA